VTGPGESPETAPALQRVPAAASGCRSGVTYDGRGVVMAEFLMAMLPIMLAFLGFTQFCFAGIAKLAVRHAAALVTRAAVVVIEEGKGLPGIGDDMYSGLLPGALEVEKPQKGGTGSGSASNSQTQVSQLSGANNNSSSTKGGRTMDVAGSAERHESRIKMIRTAAYWPLLAVSPSLFDDGVQIGQSVERGDIFQKLKVRTAIGRATPDRAFGALLYNMGAVAVTFPKAPGLQDYTDGHFQGDELITARVTYLFRCQVPLASLLMCASGWSLLFGDAWLDPLAMRSIVKMVGDPPSKAEDLPEWSARWKQEKAVHDRQQQRVAAFKGREKEFEQVEWPFMLDVLLAMPGTRYMVLSAEAQLPLQGARYYQRAGEQEMEEMWKRLEDKRKNQTQLPDVRDALRPVQKLVADAANEVDQAVEKINGTVNDIKTQVAEGVGAATTKFQEAKAQASQFVGQAQSKFDEAKRTVDGKIKTATATFDKAKRTAEGAVRAAEGKAAELLSGPQKEFDAAQAQLERAKKQGGAALAAAQQRVTDAQAQLTAAQHKATGLVEGAKTTAAHDVAAAQTELDTITREGQGIVNDAQGVLDRAQAGASEALGSATSAYNEVVQSGQGLVKDTTGQIGNAVSGVQGAASKAAGSVGNAASDLGKSAASTANGALGNLGGQLQKIKPPSAPSGGQLPNIPKAPAAPTAPGGLSEDEF